jgi:hypothetical protein
MAIWHFAISGPSGGAQKVISSNRQSVKTGRGFTAALGAEFPCQIILVAVRLQLPVSRGQAPSDAMIQSSTITAARKMMAVLQSLPKFIA